MNENNQVNAMYVATNGVMNGLNINSLSGTGLENQTNTQINTLGFVSMGGTYWNGTAWDYWQNYYYPQVIRESYPIYIKERAEDKGKQAFEVIKMLQDKRFVKFEKVSDFVEAMDALIKIL